MGPVVEIKFLEDLPIAQKRLAEGNIIKTLMAEYRPFVDEFRTLVRTGKNTLVFCALSEGKFVGFLWGEKKASNFAVKIFTALPSKKAVRETGKTVGMHLWDKAFKYAERNELRIMNVYRTPLGEKFLNRLRADKKVKLPRHL